MDPRQGGAAPEPPVRRHHDIYVVPASVRRTRTAVQHHLEDAQQPLGDLEIVLITGQMERNQDLVR